MAGWICDISPTHQKSAWHKWVKQYKLKTMGIWEVQAKKSDSIWWRQLLSVRDMMVTKLEGAARQQICATSRKERRHILYELFNPMAAQVSWGEWVWNPLNQPKASLICWLVCRGRLPTRKSLSKFLNLEDTTCGLCGRFEETIDHLFFECEVSTRILQNIMGRLEANVNQVKLNDWISSFAAARSKTNTMF